MRVETRRAVTRLELVLERIASLPGWHIEGDDGEAYSYFFDKNDARQVISLIRKLPGAEECLARGGMVKDWDGAWCRDGDRVRFRDTAGDEFETGELQYDDSTFTWYVFVDRTQDFHMLGDVFEWHKEENNDEV